jgi:hypothetical protein
MATPRAPKVNAAGNARTVIVAVLALALGAVVLAKGFPNSTGTKAVVGAGPTTTKAAGTPASSSSVPVATTPPASATTINVAASKVIVANGAQIDGVAGRISKNLSDKGYVVIAPTNTAGPASVSTVFFQPTFQGVADKVAVDLGIKSVAAMPATKPVDIKDGVILVVLGTDFKENAVPLTSSLKPGAAAPAAGATAAAPASGAASTTAPPAAAVTTPTTKKP